MAMSNTAYRRLCNEWTYNYQINDALIMRCEELGIDRFSSYINTESMKAVREYCKKNSVWLQDTLEEDLYVELMPFGGYNGDYSVLNKALKEYRKNE